MLPMSGEREREREYNLKQALLVHRRGWPTAEKDYLLPTYLVPIGVFDRLAQEGAGRGGSFQDRQLPQKRHSTARNT